MFCEKCGNKLEDGAKFCTGCGAKVVYNNQAPNVNSANNINTTNNVTSQNSANTSTQKFNPNKPKKSSTTEKKIVIGIVIFLVVLLVAGIVVMNIIKNNVKKAVKNTLGDIGQVIEEVDETVNEVIEEANKEIETTLEWKTPFLKIDKEDGTVKSSLSSEGTVDLTNYDIYAAIVSVKYNTTLLNTSNDLKSNNLVIVTASGQKVTSEEDKTTTYYYPVYIAVKSDEKVEDVEIYLKNEEDKVLKGKENNVEAKTKTYNGKATFGDCLSFTADGNRVYMILTGTFNTSSGGGFAVTYPGGDFDKVSEEVGYVYIAENSTKILRPLKIKDVFSTIITDNKIVATNSENNLKNEEEVFVSNSDIYLKSSGIGRFDIDYIYKEDSKTTEEAKKIFENKNLKLKLLDKLEVEIVK